MQSHWCSGGDVGWGGTECDTTAEKDGLIQEIKESFKDRDEDQVL